MTDGHVIIIGGAEDKVRDRVILSRFASLAGGRDGTVVVISTASSLGELAGERYKQVLGELGVKKVRAIHAITRAQANDDTVALALRDATGIFMTGGNQLRLSSTIGGTRMADAVLEQFRKGAVVAGTSAGASAMSSHMIAFGASGATPKHRMAQIAAGLGVLPGVIVDQHFQQRNRLGRLLSLIAQNPSLLGLGVDEDTAGVVGPDHVMEVIGRGSITIVDGARSRDGRLGGQGPPAADDQRCRPPLAARRLPFRPAEAGADRDAVAPCAARWRGRVELIDPSMCRRSGHGDPPYTDRPSVDRRRASVTETAEPTRTKPKRPRATRAAPGCDRGPDHAAPDAADPRDPRPARAQLLGTRAGRSGCSSISACSRTSRRTGCPGSAMRWSR